MKVQVSADGKFDKVGWQEVLQPVTVEAPAEIPVRWTIKVFGFIKATIVARIKIKDVE